MEPHRPSPFAPLTGVGVLILAIAMFAVGGSAPDPSDDSAAQIADFYAQNKIRVTASIMIAVAVAGLLVAFAAQVRQLVGGSSGVLADILFAGAIVFAAGFAVDAGITGALATNAGEVDDAALVSLSALFYSNYLYVVGGGLFLGATGLAAARHAVLPKGLGFAMVALGATAVTPVGGLTFFAMLLLPAVLGLILSRRARRTPPTSSILERHPQAA
ncbi:MAG: hypothetical protein M3459_02480 [Actinomycetota bacterium]|nr:hypothetical protein [Actinomycetota bacterium]